LETDRADHQTLEESIAPTISMAISIRQFRLCYCHPKGILLIVNMVGGKVITAIDRRLLTYNVSDNHIFSHDTPVLALQMLRPPLHALI
jgi:hypothetical protein